MNVCVLSRIMKKTKNKVVKEENITVLTIAQLQINAIYERSTLKFLLLSDAVKYMKISRKLLCFIKRVLPFATTQPDNCL